MFFDIVPMVIGIVSVKYEQKENFLNMRKLAEIGRCGVKKRDSHCSRKNETGPDNYH